MENPTDRTVIGIEFLSLFSVSSCLTSFRNATKLLLRDVAASAVKRGAHFLISNISIEETQNNKRELNSRFAEGNEAFHFLKAELTLSASLSLSHPIHMQTDDMLCDGLQDKI